MRDFSTATDQLAGIFYLTLAQLVASLVSRWLIFAELRIRALLDVDPLAVITATNKDVTVAFVAAATAILIHLLLGRRWPNLWRHLLLAFAVGHCFLLSVNAFAVQWIGGPLTFQWLYFADLLQTPTPRVALSAVLSPRLILVVTALTALPLFALWLGRLQFGSASRRLILALIGGSLTAFSLLFAASALVRPASRDDLQNRRYSPVQALLTSALSSWPSLDGCAAAVPPETLVPAAPLPRSGPVNSTASSSKPNFVLIVLESVGAKAVDANRAKLRTLDQMMRSGAVFTNAYATTASSTRSLFSLLTSRYPLVTYRPETRELQQFGFVTLPEVLRKAGYRTAYFGVDLAFQDAGRFIRAEGFDFSHDALDAACERPRHFGRGDYPSFSVPNSAFLPRQPTGRYRPDGRFF